jgi:hypothetical protein
LPVVQICAGRWGDGDPMPTNMKEMIEFTKKMEVAVPLPPWYYDFLEIIKDEAEKFSPCELVRVREYRLFITVSSIIRTDATDYSYIVLCSISQSCQSSIQFRSLW